MDSERSDLPNTVTQRAYIFLARFDSTAASDLWRRAGHNRCGFVRHAALRFRTLRRLHLLKHHADRTNRDSQVRQR